jgi:N-dimethylarginine dimethylaminohydrolase
MSSFSGIKNPDMNNTCHSEIGKIKSLFIKNVQQAFISDAHLEQHWQSLNYLGKPDMNNARKEYKLFQSILENHVAELFFLPEDTMVNMDSIYCRDASIATNKGMIICNMGKDGRINEPQAEKNAFEKKGIPILGTIMAPGTVEGGDAAWLDEHTLAVGHTYRTNEEGINQLKSLLQPLGVEVIVVHLPHYKGKADVFHLMSIFSPVDSNLAVVYSPLMPIVFRNGLLDRGYQLLEVTDEEFDSMGCNVLAIAPRECLLVKGNPVIKTELENAGCLVSVYQGEEISVKGGGGPTCLTRPIYRWT